ncbi:protein kinase family protein [Orenia marismortui]|uniref:hypothetical protein n=1 Tax=Orenia marismortui TaxID=46469 RepID=UPI00036B309B|nr:hypothetical protein [Orenia marismortui]
MIGEVVRVREKEFVVKKFLGKGKSGYSYLIENGDENYVLKKMHDEPCPYYDFQDSKVKCEISDYKRLKNLIKMPQLIEYNLEEEYLIKEYIDGPIVAELIAKKQLSEAMVERIFKIFKIMKEAKMNIDYFPTNFVVSNKELIYVDYEFNDYDPQWDLINWGIYYWANIKGMKEYLETGKISKADQAVDSGLPDKETFEEQVQKWINKYN